MEDVTDIGFRHLCKRYGAAMVYTEFVSAEALVRSVNATLRKLAISDEERPVGIQIYGRDVDSMVRDLGEASISPIRDEELVRVKDKAIERAEDRLHELVKV